MDLHVRPFLITSSVYVQELQKLRLLYTVFLLLGLNDVTEAGCFREGMSLYVVICLRGAANQKKAILDQLVSATEAQCEIQMDSCRAALVPE